MATQKTHECIQGDHFSYDFTSPAIDEFDQNWYGAWSIVSALGESPESSGTVEPSVSKESMELRIKPTDTNIITVGDYLLIVQLSNDTLYFNKEIMQDIFIVLPQGIS